MVKNASVKKLPVPKFARVALARCDVQINGPNPYDIQIRNPATFRRVLMRGSLGAGESYMDGWWDCDALDECVSRIMQKGADENLDRWYSLPVMLGWLQDRLTNLQSVARAFQVGERHYDIGNDVFEAMLDRQMIYSCGFWQRANDLDRAQTDKLDMICRKLNLQPGEKLLDIGCGWGGLAAYAAREYGVSVVGLTISREQQKWAQQTCVGLPVKIRLQDYRAVRGQFDKIVSVGMFEHVGRKNHATYFNVVKRLLKPNGLFLLHTIGGEKKRGPTDRWINRYIFPNGDIPSRGDIVVAMDERLVIEDWHNFGADYDRTLMAWLARFDAAWGRLSQKYDERFRRMWRYYLMTCAGFFRARRGYLWQLVISHQSRQETYRSVRPVVK